MYKASRQNEILSWLRRGILVGRCVLGDVLLYRLLPVDEVEVEVDMELAVPKLPAYLLHVFLGFLIRDAHNPRQQSETVRLNNLADCDSGDTTNFL